MCGSHPVIPALSRNLPSLQRQRRKSEIFGEIAPGGILLIDEVIFPCSRPSLDRLLKAGMTIVRSRASISATGRQRTQTAPPLSMLASRPAARAALAIAEVLAAPA